MIDELLNNFPDILTNGCFIELNTRHSFILDDEITKRGIFVDAKDKYHLHIEKVNALNLHFIQNDDCVMKSEKGGQCDYLIFNIDKVIFSEIKATKENLSNRRKQALKQIENTIKFYFKKDLFINHPNKFALVTFDNNKRIAPQASNSTKRKEFKVKYDVSLNEGNYIVFE